MDLVFVPGNGPNLPVGADWQTPDVGIGPFRFTKPESDVSHGPMYPAMRMWKVKVSCGSFVFLKLAKELEAGRQIIFKLFTRCLRTSKLLRNQLQI
jgi:hypothetical protein